MSIPGTHAGAELRRFARLAAFAALCLLAPIAPQRAVAGPTAATSPVEIAKFTFTPMEITIAAGTRVVWTNRDETPHSVQAADKSFASTGLDTGDTFEHTFAKPGDYAYVCSVHPFMKGIVHVRAP